jgi:hypothetical protein
MLAGSYSSRGNGCGFELDWDPASALALELHLLADMRKRPLGTLPLVAIAGG